MINFKISDISDGLITVLKPAGKPIPLNIGEIVKGDVTDLLATGGVTLRIKGSYITARTDIPLQKDSQVMLRVLGTPSSPNELRLEFLGFADREQTTAAQGDVTGRLAKELSGLDSNTLSSEKIANLVKALPSDISTIPKEIRLQLQNILQQGLQSTGNDIQTRLDAFFRDLPASIKNQSFIQGLKLEVVVSAENLLSDGFRGLLRDTGVALEAKLKAVAELIQQGSKESGDKDTAQSASGKAVQVADIRQMMPKADRASIENDLKTNLLRLKETLISQSDSVSNKDAAAIKGATSTIDGMLKDIESYQLMSKATGSFYTFLPVSWQELKDGDIAFKSNSGEGKTPSFSCRLNLELDGFGRLVIMVLSHNNEYLVSFKPEREDFKALLATNIESLNEQFSASGLNLKAVRVLDKDDTSLEQLENLEPYRQIVSIKA
jgi:hypothetical protein